MNRYRIDYRQSGKNYRYYIAARNVENAEALDNNPFGATMQDLYNETRLSMTVIKNSLEKMDNVEKRGDSWLIKSDTPAEIIEATAEQPVIQDDGGNYPNNGGNYPNNGGNYPDNGTATLINPNTGREYVELPETGQTIKEQILEQVAQSEETPKFELQPPPISIYQKHFILIEHCYLSLAQDGTGQEPALAKDTWFDDEGEAVSEDDCKVLNRAVERPLNEVEFRGVTYRNLFVAESQLFHGVFDDIQSATARMNELMAKKPSNNFEVMEV